MKSAFACKTGNYWLYRLLMAQVLIVGEAYGRHQAVQIQQ